MPDMGSYREPEWAHLKELKLGDAWLARWIKDEALPADVPVGYAYGLVFLGDKGYVTKLASADGWRTVEGAPNGIAIETYLKQAAKEQTGATIGRLELVGFLYCKATSYNPDYEAGAATTRPIYVLVASKMNDVPDGSGFVRRRLPLNEYLMALRDRYPEIGKHMTEASEKYSIMQARGEV
ncbi:MAG: hypothetical protein ABI782_12005 [Anaerolineaceae bacterium]